MFLQSIHALARYNLWANEQLAQRLETLNEEQYHAEIASSFPSILKTLAHIHGAEDIWRQRLHNIKQSTFYKLSDDASGAVEVNKWLEASKRLTDLILSYDDNDLVTPVDYFRFDGTAQNSFRWQMIQHCVNHSSYHRGQLITMMRQVGVTLVPNTDMISFYRTHGDTELRTKN
jgi:uncharacterized damage-inducible protein DinB